MIGKSEIYNYLFHMVYYHFLKMLNIFTTASINDDNKF